MASEGLPDISAVKQEKKTSLMSVPARSALMLPWNFMRKARINYSLSVAVVDSASEGQETTVRVSDGEYQDLR